MRICPACRTPYPNNTQRCVRDNTHLTDSKDLLEQEADPKTLFGEIVGNYRLLSRLGVGGMGVVYEGAHVSIKKLVAVKVIHKEQLAEENVLERFYQEAQSMAQLSHENIIQVLDFGCAADGRPFFVMELLEGRELYRVLSEEQRFGVERAVKICRQICRGLVAAHAKQIIHRDLKPENIFLTSFAGESDFVKILDFGIAFQMDPKAETKRLTNQHQVLGTAPYMSPEQAQGKLDPRSDLYSLGVMLFEMLTGELPFFGENAMDIVFKHLTEPVRPPRSLNPEIPAALEAIILRALEKRVEDRFSSAAEFLAALDAFTESPAIEQTLVDPSPALILSDSMKQDASTPHAPASLQSAKSSRLSGTALAEHSILDASSIAGPEVSAQAPPKRSSTPIFMGLSLFVVCLAVLVFGLSLSSARVTAAEPAPALAAPQAAQSASPSSLPPTKRHPEAETHPESKPTAAPTSLTAPTKPAAPSSVPVKEKKKEKKDTFFHANEEL